MGYNTFIGGSSGENIMKCVFRLDFAKRATTTYKFVTFYNHTFKKG